MLESPKLGQPSSIWGTSAGALNALWSLSPEVQERPPLLLSYWISLGRRLIVAAICVLLICAMLFYALVQVWPYEAEWYVIVWGALELVALLYLVTLVLAARGQINRVPGLLPATFVRKLVPRPEALTTSHRVYMCVADVGCSVPKDMWNKQPYGVFMCGDRCDGQAIDLDTDDAVPAFNVAVASASLPVLVRAEELGRYKVLDGGLVANLPAGYMEAHGALGGLYIACIVPRKLKELRGQDSIDNRTLRYLHAIKSLQARSREDGVLQRGGVASPLGHIPAFVLTPQRGLRSGIACFWPPLLRAEFEQGRQEASEFLAHLQKFLDGEQSTLQRYLLEELIDGGGATGSADPAWWQPWANTEWP